MDRVTRHHVAFVLALVLAGLPFSSTVCLALCASSGSARAHESHGVTHHGPRAAYEHTSHTPSQPALAAVAGHGCLGHAGLVRESTEALAPGRADVGLVALAPDPGRSQPAVLPLLPPLGHSGCSPPLTSSNRAPLVLRV